MNPQSEVMADFSLGHTEIRFRVDGDVFVGAPDMATELAMEMADQLAVFENPETPTEDQIKALHTLLRTVLFPESAERFIARLKDPSNPLGPVRLGKIVQWLMEQYGVRPTEQDSESLTGSESQAAGTKSTENTSVVA